MKEKLMNGLKWLFRSFIWLGVLLLIVDIITKQVIVHTGNPDTVIADWGFVHISYVLNYHAAFGFGPENKDVSRIVYLVTASVISIALVVYLILKRKQTKLFVRAALVMVVTGAIGNMIDRIFYGPYYAVVDWIDFYWFWPFVFNIADCCIVIAAFMLVIYVIVQEVKDYRAKNKATVKPVGKTEKVLSKSEKEKLEMENAQEKESK